MEGGIPAVLIYEDLEHLTPYMHTTDDVVGKSLNSPELLEGNARLAAAGLAVLADVPGGEPGEFQRGDTNGDGTTNLSDAVFLLGYLFLGDRAPACADAADSNDDSAMDIADAITILNFLFVGGVAIPPPTGACGPDPSEDGLSCSVHTPCA